MTAAVIAGPAESATHSGHSFPSRSHSVINTLEETGTALSHFIAACALNEDQKANLSEVVRSLTAQQIALRIAAEDPHTEVSDSDKLDLLARAERSIEAAQAFLQAPE